jgi:hypothetical protein
MIKSMAGHVARVGEEGDPCRILVRKPEGVLPLRRSRRRWEDNIKMDLREIDGILWSEFIWSNI